MNITPEKEAELRKFASKCGIDVPHDEGFRVFVITIYEECADLCDAYATELSKIPLGFCYGPNGESKNIGASDYKLEAALTLSARIRASYVDDKEFHRIGYGE
ncbi:MAG: hypothetical protein JO253_03290 [Alphaproteobacteria bacterium]|nr:hypothetical protein [Alphaproteobacteria bacterium]